MISQIISFQVLGKWFSQGNVTVFKLDVREEHEDETRVDLGMLRFSSKWNKGIFSGLKVVYELKSRDEGHMWAKSAGKWRGRDTSARDEVTRSHEGSYRCKWDTVEV